MGNNKKSIQTSQMDNSICAQVNSTNVKTDSKSLSSVLIDKERNKNKVQNAKITIQNNYNQKTLTNFVIKPHKENNTNSEIDQNKKDEETHEKNKNEDHKRWENSRFQKKELIDKKKIHYKTEIQIISKEEKKIEELVNKYNIEFNELYKVVKITPFDQRKKTHKIPQAKIKKLLVEAINIIISKRIKDNTTLTEINNLIYTGQLLYEK